MSLWGLAMAVCIVGLVLGLAIVLANLQRR